jgi:lipoprotein LpqH
LNNRFVTGCSSRKRLIGAAAVISCAMSVGGCASGPSYSAQPKGSISLVTAEFTINGKPAGSTHEIQCFQDDWNHTIETGNPDSGVRMVVGMADKVSPDKTVMRVTARSVVLTNVGGFSGSFIENQIGTAKASIYGTTFAVSGTADGANTDDPNKKTTATFDIKANC